MNNIIYYSIIKKDRNTSSDLLKKMLDKLNIKMPNIIIDDNKKPYFENSNLFFNCSHTKNYLACAISYNDVGIDIEETNRIISDNLANKYLEYESNNNKRIEKWVMKESYSKLKGLGISMGLQNIDLNILKNANKLIKNNDYICSIYSELSNISFKKIDVDK